jgi:hypothetical protein
LINRHPSFEPPGVPDVRPGRLDGGPPAKIAATFRWVLYHRHMKKRASKDPWEMANLKWAEATLEYRASVPYEERFWWARDSVQDYHHSLAMAYRSSENGSTHDANWRDRSSSVVVHIGTDEILEVIKIWLWEWNWPGADHAQKMLDDLRKERPRKVHFRKVRPRASERGQFTQETLKQAISEFERYLGKARGGSANDG